MRICRRGSRRCCSLHPGLSARSLALPLQSDTTSSRVAVADRGAKHLNCRIDTLLTDWATETASAAVGEFSANHASIGMMQERLAIASTSMTDKSPFLPAYVGRVDDRVDDVEERGIADVIVASRASGDRWP